VLKRVTFDILKVIFRYEEKLKAAAQLDERHRHQHHQPQQQRYIHPQSWREIDAIKAPPPSVDIERRYDDRKRPLGPALGPGAVKDDDWFHRDERMKSEACRSRYDRLNKYDNPQLISGLPAHPDRSVQSAAVLVVVL